MVKRPDEELLATCFQEVTGTAPVSVATLTPHASERRIYRLVGVGRTLVGVVNPSRSENDAFVALARHFRGLGLPVPTIHAYRPEQGLYLEDDLGDITLLNFLSAERTRTGELFPKGVRETYAKVLSFLPRFQIEAAASLDFSVLSANDFFTHTLKSDMLSFSAELVGRLLPNYNVTPLEKDFAELSTYLSQAKSGFFLYRDFQSRNIMLVNGEPVFIDFQSGLCGPLQYDVVSLLYQSSAQIPETNREFLLEIYLHAVSKHTQFNREDFLRYYPAFIVTRMLQVLGVYGRQGLGAKKEYFARSIPEALKTLNTHLHSPQMPLKLDGLRVCSQALLKEASTRN